MDTWTKNHFLQAKCEARQWSHMSWKLPRLQHCLCLYAGFLLFVAAHGAALWKDGRIDIEEVLSYVCFLVAHGAASRHHFNIFEYTLLANVRIKGAHRAALLSVSTFVFNARNEAWRRFWQPPRCFFPNLVHGNDLWFGGDRPQRVEFIFSDRLQNVDFQVKGPIGSNAANHWSWMFSQQNITSTNASPFDLQSSAGFAFCSSQPLGQL